MSEILKADKFIDKEFPTRSIEYGVKDYDVEDVMLGWNEGVLTGLAAALQVLKFTHVDEHGNGQIEDACAVIRKLIEEAKK